MSHEILGLVRWQGLFFKPCVGDLEEVNMTGKVKVTSCSFFEALLQHGYLVCRLCSCFSWENPTNLRWEVMSNAQKKSSGFSSGNELPQTFQSFQEWRTRRYVKELREENHGRSV